MEKHRGLKYKEKEKEKKKERRMNWFQEKYKLRLQ